MGGTELRTFIWVYSVRRVLLVRLNLIISLKRVQPLCVTCNTLLSFNNDNLRNLVSETGFQVSAHSSWFLSPAHTFLHVCFTVFQS